jgi:hypothetical protein
MVHYHSNDWDSPEGRLKMVQGGARRHTTTGSHIADLAALGKCICLCGNCISKFNPASVNYHRLSRPPLNQGAVGECDGCKEFTMCKIHMPVE